MELARGTGEHHDELFLSRGHKAPGRGAHGIFEGCGSLGKQGLDKLVVAHGPCAEVFLQPREAVLILHEGEAQRVGYGLFCEIVECGAESSRR